MNRPRIFLDLDGTVYLDGLIIDNVDREIRRLSEEGCIFHYMTNNTSIGDRDYQLKIEAYDLPVKDGALVYPTLVLLEWLRKNSITHVYALGTASFLSQLDRAGVNPQSQNPSCIIVAFDRQLTYSKLEHACRLINAGIPYYLTHIDMSCPTGEGPIPDCGSFGALLKSVTGKDWSGHFGKPGEMMTDYIKSLIQPNEHVIVAGDRLYTDIEIGIAIGAETILVESGEFKSSTASNINSRVKIHRTLSDYLRCL